MRPTLGSTGRAAEREAQWPKDAVAADTPQAWRNGLRRHHTRSLGAWRVMWKKSSGRARMSCDQAVQEALCHGWIDSRPRRLDVETLAIPADLHSALDADRRAAAHCAAFPRSTKRSILEWIANARKAETRATRVAESARLARDKLRANQWRSQST